MWRVKPDIQHRQRNLDVIHLDAFLRGAHLLPVFGKDFLPSNFVPEFSLDAFCSFYVNRFADHHMHEIIF